MADDFKNAKGPKDFSLLEVDEEIKYNVLSTLFGPENFYRWQRLKCEMKFTSDAAFVGWLLDVATATEGRSGVPTTVIVRLQAPTTGGDGDNIDGIYETTVATAEYDVLDTDASQDKSVDNNVLDDAPDSNNASVDYCDDHHGPYNESDHTSPHVEALSDAEVQSEEKKPSKVKRWSKKIRSKPRQRSVRNVRSYPCEVCGATFPLLRERMSHIRTVHDMPEFGQKASLFSCPSCPGKTFRYRCRLRKHIRWVHERQKPSVCEICGTAFYEDTILRKHIKTVHDRVISHHCDMCDRGFVYPKAYYDHMRTKHNTRVPFVGDAATDQGLQLPPTSHVCDTCGKAFPTTDGIRRHSETHLPANERKVVCQLCGRHFMGRRSLWKHQWMVHRNRGKIPVSEITGGP